MTRIDVAGVLTPTTVQMRPENDKKVPQESLIAVRLFCDSRCTGNVSLTNLFFLWDMTEIYGTAGAVLVRKIAKYFHAGLGQIYTSLQQTDATVVPFPDPRSPTDIQLYCRTRLFSVMQAPIRSRSALNKTSPLIKQVWKTRKTNCCLCCLENV